MIKRKHFLHLFVFIILLTVLNIANRKLNQQSVHIQSKKELHYEKLNLFNEEQKRLISDNDNFFVIEPEILRKTMPDQKWIQLRWRYNLTTFDSNFNHKSITLGTFSDSIFHKIHQLKVRGNLATIFRIEDAICSSKEKNVLHWFLQSATIKVHVVVFYRVKHFFWLGAIEPKLLNKLQDFKISYGLYEEIFDLFGVDKIGTIQYPDDVAHFLSQTRTSKYLPCPAKQANMWVKQYNIPVSNARIQGVEEAIVAMKLLMRTHQMQFWMMSGTLLGWLRQCGVTPHDVDTDFAVWSHYLFHEPLVEKLHKSAWNCNLRLVYRYGSPRNSLELSFRVNTLSNEQVDLFFMYANQTHLQMPLHVHEKHLFGYYNYLKFELCSTELLGYKLLVPCDPQTTILTEYGPNWSKPIRAEDYDYVNMPYNVGPLMRYVETNLQRELIYLWHFSPVVFVFIFILSSFVLVSTFYFTKSFKLLLQYQQ